MDYDQLFAVLPKTHWHWNIEDTKKWLSFIGLDSLHKKFESCAIDGSILSALNEDDFNRELEITSKVIVKKLMNWITIGIPQFDSFVEEQIQIKCTHKLSEQQLRSKANLSQEKNRQGRDLREGKSKPREVSHTQQPKRYEANELIIKQLEQNQVGNFFLKEKGGMIGRHAQNEIVILDEFVSRYHAEIIYDQDQYFIKDCGSSSGTFLKIGGKKEITNGMIIEMGSNQFQATLDHVGNITMKVIDGPNQDSVYILNEHEVYSVGRKETNQMNFPDDQHLSGIHSKIFRIKDLWYIEDIATTNGTWLRLSREGEESPRFLLEDKCQFKLSSNLIYQCKLNCNNRKTFKGGEQKCVHCLIGEKDSVILPCKHVAGCWSCLNNQEVCPLCKSQIIEVIKMYTA